MTRRYIGTELELFSAATNWKSYFSDVLAPYIKGRVLEVGSGIGSNIPYLCTSAVHDWTSLEPDSDLARRITNRASLGTLPACCRVVGGTLENINPGARFDTILYIDVLEHIADDEAELRRAAQLLAPGGNLIVLAPAHQFLYSPFDEALGHWRRYGAAKLVKLTPQGCCIRTRLMLDSAGFFASLANRILLKKEVPSPRQIAFWDRILVPISRVLDAATHTMFGKSAVIIWSRAP